MVLTGSQNITKCRASGVFRVKSRWSYAYETPLFLHFGWNLKVLLQNIKWCTQIVWNRMWKPCWDVKRVCFCKIMFREQIKLENRHENHMAAEMRLQIGVFWVIHPAWWVPTIRFQPLSKFSCSVDFKTIHFCCFCKGGAFNGWAKKLYFSCSLATR